MNPNRAKKESQRKAAVKWCHDNQQRRWSTTKTGNFPMLNDPRIINRRLDKDVDINAYENRSILTDIDESSIVPHLKSMNR